jgi:1,4-dihydroxy-2-naphthoate octaprenyltransferase
MLFGVLYYTSPYNFIYAIMYIPFLMHLVKVINNKDLKLLDPELKKLALSTFFLAILMGLGQLL